MGKVVYPQKGEKIVCEVCQTPMRESSDYSEDGQEEYRWCEDCLDYRDGKIRTYRKGENGYKETAKAHLRASKWGW